MQPCTRAVLRVNVTTTTVTATSTTTAATVTSTPTTTTTPAPTFEEFCYIAQTNFSAAKTLQQVVRPITHFPKRHPLTLANWCGGSSRDDNRISNSEPYCPQCFQCGYTKWGTGKPPLSAYVGKGPKVTLNQNSCRVRPESRPGFSQSDRSNCVAGGCDACTCAAPCKATTRTTGVCTPRDPDKCTMTLIKGTANRFSPLTSTSTSTLTSTLTLSNPHSHSPHHHLALTIAHSPPHPSTHLHYHPHKSHHSPSPLPSHSPPHHHTHPHHHPHHHPHPHHYTHSYPH